MGAFAYLDKTEKAQLQSLKISSYEDAKKELDGYVKNLRWDLFKVQKPDWKAGSTEDKAASLSSAKKNAERIQFVVDTYLSKMDSQISKEISGYLKSVYALKENSDLSSHFEAGSLATASGKLADFVSAFDALDSSAFGTTGPKTETIDVTAHKSYRELSGMQAAKDYLAGKFGEEYSKEAAMYFSYDVKYGGGKAGELGLGKESSTTMAARDYVKQAYDALASDSDKTEFLKTLGEFYLTVGVGRARRMISDFSKTGKSENGFMTKLFGATKEKVVEKPEEQVSETGTHNIGVNAVTNDLFAKYGLQSLAFTYNKSDFDSKNLSEPVEGMAHYVLTFTGPDGKPVTKEGEVANHILGSYFAALSTEDADTVREKLGDVLHMFETKGDIAIVTAAPEKTATDLVLDLLQGKGPEPIVKETEAVRTLESTVNSILNSSEKTDWKQIYSTLQSAKPEEFKSEIDGIITTLNKSGISAEDKAKNDFALLQLSSMYGFIGGKTKDTDTKSKTEKEVFAKINGKELIPYCMSVLPPALQPSVNCVKETGEARQAYNNFFTGLFYDWNKMSINEDFLQNPETFMAQLKANLPVVAQNISVSNGMVSFSEETVSNVSSQQKSSGPLSQSELDGLSSISVKLPVEGNKENLQNKENAAEVKDEDLQEEYVPEKE